MPRKSAAQDASSAFELFLDTISNAFGGIIFVSLLVCVLLQLTGRSLRPSPIDPSLLAKLRNEFNSLQNEVKKLQDLREAQLGAIKALGPSSDPNLLREYLRLHDLAQSLRQDQRDKSIKLVGIREAALRLSRERDTQAAERDKLRVDKAKIEKAIQDARGRPAVELREPMFRETDKQQVPILVSGRRMRFIQKYNASGGFTGLNRDDADFTMDANGNVAAVRPKADRGFLITDKDALAAELRRQLGKFTAKPTDPNTDPNAKTERQCHYPAIFVWPDSFTEGAWLRDLSIGLGFDYFIVPMKEGEPVKPGAGGTKSSL